MKKIQEVEVLEFIEEEIIKILTLKPSECAYLDYKEVPYMTNKKHDFIKDVIAMLNSEEAYAKDKVIVIGVVDQNKYLKGIDIQQWTDDNIFQNWIDNIDPRPSIQTGTVEYEEKTFGYIFISKENIKRIYEVNKTVIGEKSDQASVKAGVYQGQAFTRQGSRNSILMQNEREEITKKKIRPDDKEYIAYRSVNTYNPMTKIKPIVVAALVGEWNENNTGDLSVIEEIYGGTYNLFIRDIRIFYESNKDNIELVDNRWKINNRLSLLQEIANEIYDEHIDGLFFNIQKIWGEVDPKYGLPSEQRYASSVYLKNEKKVYSNNIRRGLIEFMAIAGNNTELFVSCSRYKIENCIAKEITKIFTCNDWKVYASLSEELDLLAESNPETFLSELEKALRNKKSSFIDYLNQKETGISETKYGYQLGWTLAKLASYSEYFAKSCSVLFLLSEFRLDFLPTLVGIVLPWYPQTTAKPNVRIGMIKGLLAENIEVGWNLLMMLMPKKTTIGNPVQQAKYMKNNILPESVTNKEFWELTIAYIRIACTYAIGDCSKLLQFVDIIDDVPVEIFMEVIETFKKSTPILNNSEKEIIWNKIEDLITKHRKYSSSNWALPEEAIKVLEDLLIDYFPNDEYIQNKRMFRKEQYELVDRKDNWEEAEKGIFERQKEIIKIIYKEGGVEAVYQFNENIERVDIAGRCLAYIRLTAKESKSVIEKLESNILKKTEFVRGFILEIYYKNRVNLDKILNKINSEMVKIKVFAILPISEENINEVKNFSGEVQNFYWENIDIWGADKLSIEYFEFAVKKLNEVKRISKSIELIYYIGIHNKLKFDVLLIYNTLNLYVGHQNTDPVDAYKLGELIGRLQNECDDEETIVEIEWKYLNILDGDGEHTPKYLYRKLSTKPEFFMEILSVAFKARNEEKRNLTEQEKILASHCHKLLFSWKLVPGLLEDGSMDYTLLSYWFDTVSGVSKDKDRYGVAMTYFGHTLFHAPADKDRFFIDRKIAEILQNDIEGNIRSGYSTEAYNSRGVHWVDPTGSAEFMLEEAYNKKAEESEVNGYFRLGEMLRKISKSYHYEAIHNIEEEKQWSKES